MLKKKYFKQKYGIFDAYINNKNQENNLFVFAQMNAARCIGKQDQKNKLRNRRKYKAIF